MDKLNNCVVLCTESSILQSLKSLQETKHIDDDRTQLTRRSKNVLGSKESFKLDLKGEEKYLRVTEKNQRILSVDKITRKSWICPRGDLGKMLERNLLYKVWWDTGIGYPEKWVSHPQRCLSPGWIRPWAAKSAGWLPSPQQWAETGWLLGFISTQAILYFYDLTPKDII